MRKYLLVLVLCFAAGASFSQAKPRFWDDVQTIRAYDKLFEPAAHPIVFVGSSSIRKWDTLQVVFGKYNVINRAIGGAVIDDIQFYLEELVFSYKPRQVVLYVGENDVPNEQETADTILSKMTRLFRSVRAKLPGVPIVFIAFKPSPVRDKFKEKAVKSNGLIREFLSKEKDAVFVDVYKPMLDKKGNSRPELFGPDMLHMNSLGYAIWRKAVQKHLLKNKS